MAEHKSINQPKTTTCTLDEKVQDLLKTIFDVKLMGSVVKEMKYDLQMQPLGQLTEANIISGYIALREIQSLVIAGGNDKQSLLRASNDYYLNIPHNFGTTNVSTVIQSLDRIQEERELLKVLSDIRIALNLITDIGDVNVHPLDRYYQLMKCNITPISSESDVYQLVNRYLILSDESTLTQYPMTMLELYELRRDSEWENFKDYGNKMLLWHGSRTISYGAILNHGLRKSLISGHIFHKGLHFADMCWNSSRNVFPTRSKNIGFLLLCEVSLGGIYELSNLNDNDEELPLDCNSLKVRGVMETDSSKWVHLNDDVKVPLGPPLDNKLDEKETGFMLNSTEYIVYNTNQIKLRYLVKVEFRFKN